MAFVNERVSEEDIQRYGLDELVGAANKDQWKNGRPVVFTHAWTVDRSKSAFVIRLAYVMNYDTPSGIPMPSFEEICLLCFDGDQYRFHITKQDSSSKSRKERPYRLVWKITKLSVPEQSKHTSEDVLEIIKEAIAVRGESGIFSSMNDFETSFVG